jgi:cell division protein FtsN
MKNTETGEFELVLGNKQLLSGFFLVVILFAVFFVMGYIVGRNSTPTTQLAATHDQNSAAMPSGARPQPAGTAPAEQNPPAAVTEPPKDDAGAATPATEPQPTTQPAQPAQTKTEAAPPAAAPPAQPAPGETYLQAYSGKQEVAETVSHTLKQKGFPTLLSPGPQGKTRVLVGPYPDLGKLGQAKADLERLGFSPFRQKIER